MLKSIRVKQKKPVRANSRAFIKSPGFWNKMLNQNVQKLWQ
jgi:hypothetical protein